MTYAINIKKVSTTQYLCQVSDSSATYSIKFDSNNIGIQSLSDYLGFDVSKLGENESKNLPSQFDQVDVKILLATIAYKLGKEVISLSPSTKKSAKDVPLFFSCRELSPYQYYWNGHTPYALFSVLSADIIEIPYADAPTDYEYRFGNIAFHTNHGTNHAIRQYILIKNSLDFIKREGNTVSKQTANQLTQEEKACIELAGFLFRSGRTNELGWSEDTTYGQRSAEIFRHVAGQLGFNDTLIDLIAQSFDYHSDLKVTKPLLNQTIQQTSQKAQLFRDLLELSHESDLVRCETKSAKLQSSIETILTRVLPNAYDVKTSATSFLHLAAELNRKTGARIDAQDYRNNHDASEQIGNTALMVSTSNDVVGTCNVLNAIRPSLYPASQSPTNMWFQSSEHVYRDTESNIRIWGHSEEGVKVTPKLSWGIEEINTVPTGKCIKHESDHMKDFVSVYHATTKASRALELFCKALAPSDEQDITWHRTAREYNGKVTYQDIDTIKCKSSENMDNGEHMAWHLLSCNPTLWHNADYDSQESSVDYYLNNASVTQHDFSTLIFELLDRRGLLVGHHDLRIKLVKEFNELVNNTKFGKQGIIYQYLIPHHLVDQVAYISGKNGKLDAENPSALDTLYALKTPAMQVKNQHTLQVRLFVPKLMDPMIACQLKVVTYSAMASNLENEFNRIIEKLAKEALEGPTKVVKASSLTTDVGSYQFNALANLSKPSDLGIFKANKDISVLKPLSNNDDACPLFDPDFEMPLE
ncbi:SidE phosphodiesterase domain-containing protein [Legionella sp. W05-934-2]|uniref:SidE phosphodiesterase domain-containing protein n=1 Tax=Legionella sp. W05-934-2 TaxID=1198649 RepID=UPI003461E513